MPKDEMMHTTSYTLLGARCDALTKRELLRFFEQTIESDQVNAIVGHHNLHSLYLLPREPRMRRFYELNSLTYMDGMPLIFWGKLLGLPLKRKHRTAFLDWHEDFFSLAEAKGWRVFYLGGRQESLTKASRVLRTLHPKLFVRLHHGFFADSELSALYKEINDYQPHIILVGMGMPRQENWIVAARESIRANVIVSGGAMIEYLIGEQTATPRYLGQFGLEWLFRFATQPRRLARRYLVEPLYLVKRLARDLGASWTDTGSFERAQKSRCLGGDQCACRKRKMNNSFDVELVSTEK